jgi:hypothetical protein
VRCGRVNAGFSRATGRACRVSPEAETERDRTFWLELAAQWDALAADAGKQEAPPKRG